MLKNHRDIQSWVKKQYNRRFDVLAEIDGQNALPDRRRHWYQPDILIMSKKGMLRYIIEVENDPTRKALVGACILADYSVCTLKQKTRPSLIFIVYNESGKCQMHNFKEKLKIARSYCKGLGSIRIVTDDQFRRMRLK